MFQRIESLDETLSTLITTKRGVSG
jgi:hypothetical protein